MPDWNSESRRILISGRNSTILPIKNTSAGIIIPCMGSTLWGESYFRSTKYVDMYSELRQFLILHQELPLPGLGMMHVDRRPAQFDIANRQILPPTYQIGFRN